MVTHISDWLDFAAIQSSMGDEYKLTADLTPQTNGYDAVNTDTDTDTETGLPIGEGARVPFSGTLDGNGHAIVSPQIGKQKDITQTAQSWRIGLFRNIIDGGTIKDLAVCDATVCGNRYVGTIAGRAENATITNCLVTGTIVGLEQVGGLVGQSTGSSISNTTADTTVINTDSQNTNIDPVSDHPTKKNNSIGGICGVAYSTTLSSNVYNTTVSGSHKVGGVIGLVGDDTRITNSIIETETTGQTHVGGIAGQAGGKINRLCLAGSVSGRHTVGGIVGTGAHGPDITNIYTTATVEIDPQIGADNAPISDHADSIVAEGDHNTTISSYEVATDDEQYYATVTNTDPDPITKYEKPRLPDPPLGITAQLQTHQTRI